LPIHRRCCKKFGAKLIVRGGPFDCVKGTALAQCGDRGLIAVAHREVDILAPELLRLRASG
jgi:hypothetical protein